MERSKESRQKVYDAVEAYMDKFTDVRLGQLMTYVQVLCQVDDLFHMEDNRLADGIKYVMETHLSSQKILDNKSKCQKT